MSMPNPALLAKRPTAPRTVILTDAVLATVRADAPAKGDLVVKTKHLKPGDVIRPFVQGEPRGAVRTVESVERIGDGETWFVTFSTPHPDLPFKAAYRWHKEA